MAMSDVRASKWLLIQAMPFRGEMTDERLWEGTATEQALTSSHSCPALPSPLRGLGNRGAGLLGSPLPVAAP